MLRSRTAAVLAACAVLTGTVACGTTSENSGQAQQNNGASSKCKGPDAKYTIGMSQANRAEPYRERMDDDIRTAAASVPQFTVEFADAQQDNSRQVSDVESFITKQVDLLIISPNEATPLTAVVQGIRPGHPGGRAGPQGGR